VFLPLQENYNSAENESPTYVTQLKERFKKLEIRIEDTPNDK